MSPKWLVLSFVCAGLAATAPAAEKKPWTGRMSNDQVYITATVLTEKEDIKQTVGADLAGSIVLVEVRVRPGEGKKLTVNRDDFYLKTDKDGQKSQPFAPSQIAGKGALVVSQSAGGGGTFMGNPNGPVWGGLGGDRPGRMGGDGGALGNSADPNGTTTVTGQEQKEDPVLAKLKELVLPEKEIAEEMSGWLYFPLEGKQKPKDLELWYRGPAGRLTIRFKP